MPRQYAAQIAKYTEKQLLSRVLWQGRGRAAKILYAPAGVVKEGYLPLGSGKVFVSLSCPAEWCTSTW